MKIKIRSRPMFYTGIALLFLPLLFMCNFETGLYINVTASEPIGIYRAVSYQELKYGDYVVFDVPDSAAIAVERGWMREGQRMLKKVYALPGDTYQITDEEILVKGSTAGPVFDRDREGEALPKLRGDFTVRADYFLPIASRKPNSFDGRYFGDVPQSLIIKKVEPILLIPEGIL